METTRKVDFTQREVDAFLRSDFCCFLEKVFYTVTPGVKFNYNWHLQAIAEYLMACKRREIKRLIINIPPRSLKSTIGTVAFPAFLLGHDPSTKIMAASYSKQLSIMHSVQCRLVMESDWYRRIFSRTIISPDDNQKSSYTTTMRGHRVATSTGGTVTGQGGNFLIIDDPHNAMEAQSETIRKSQIDWFDQSFSTRLNDKENDVIIVIMQRLHSLDLTGHLQAKGGWTNLCLPAIFEEPKTISIGSFQKTIKAGELLHEDRDNKKILDDTKVALGSYAFSAQYLMAPAPPGGGIFKREWVKVFPNDKPLPKFDAIIQSVDSALTANTFSDYTAFTAWGIFEEKGKRAAMLLDAWQERLEYPDLKKKLQLEWKTRYGEGEGRRADFILIEDKGSGISLIQDMQRMGIPVRKYNPGQADKVQRAHLITYLFEAGCIYFPESDRFKGKFLSWAEDVLEQLMTFPNADHDDYVDSTTQAVRLLRDMSFLKVSSDPDEEPAEDNIPLVNPYGV